MRPEQDAFEQLARQGNLVPVVREILADLDTPLSLYRRLDDGRTTFLLESVEGAEKWARYSFIGVGARAIFRARGTQVEWTQGDATTRFDAGPDPLAFLRDRLREKRPAWPEGLELPRFVGGAVGMSPSGLEATIWSRTLLHCRPKLKYIPPVYSCLSIGNAGTSDTALGEGFSFRTCRFFLLNS